MELRLMMVHLPALLAALVYVAATPAVASSRLLLEDAAARPVLRVGFGAEPRMPMSSLENSQPKGFEGLLIEALARQAGYDLQIVPLGAQDREPALLNGTVDAVLNSFTVTAERSRLVQFLFPSHYSSGAAVFAPDGLIEGVSSWGDLSGRTLSVLEGNYVLDAAPQTPALQNVTLLPVQSIEEAVALVYAGEADGLLDDSANLFPAPNLTIVELEPILRAPMSVAVRIGDDALAQNLTKALLSLVEGGPNAPILRMENETFIAAGAAANPDLAALVANPTPGNSLLYPAKEGECLPPPSDSIWLPADAYQLNYTWKVVGMQNYSCDAATGAYANVGWMVNGTNVETGKHAGYSYTAHGLAGTHVPLFIATDESNSTVLGTLTTVREAGSLDMPSPTDPAANMFWYRRPAFDQSGVFAAPKILFVTKTDTEGGVLPAAAGPCKQGDPVIYVPTSAIISFFTCRTDV